MTIFNIFECGSYDTSQHIEILYKHIVQFVFKSILYICYSYLMFNLYLYDFHILTTIMM